jgi:chemotaxis protein methyltransferase CheR
MKPASFETIAALLKRGSGLVLGPEKQYLLETRLGPLLARHHVAGLDELAARLRPSGVVLGDLERDVVEAMTTNESFFFRDDKPFAHFRNSALPRLHSARPPGARLRIWSAAASSGQEAYSLAMIVSEAAFPPGVRPVDIVGTDISREQLARARAGLYSQFEVQRGLPMQNLVRHFRKDGASWRINDVLRGMVTFREWNLLGDLRALGQFDVVFCRNVLIYFDAPTKTRVLEAVAAQLAPDGVLYLGGAETVIGLTDRFVVSPGDRGVYELAKRSPPRTKEPLRAAV